MGKTQGEAEENHLSGGQEADRCGAESAVGESEACCHSAVVKKPTRSHRCTLSGDLQSASTSMFFLRDQSPYGLAPFCRIFLLQELREYEFHPGAKSADAKGKPSGKQSFGLLRRRHVRVERIIYIGKESNRFEEIKAGVIHSPERVYTEYPDPHREEWQTKIRPLHSKENTANSQPAELDIVFAGGGTISGVTTASGSGLTSGGTSGTLNLGLTKSCAANQVLQWNGSSWVCAAVGISPAGEDATTATRFDFAQLVNSCGEHRLPRLLSA